MIQWENALVTSIARRRAVLVVGSGVSRNSVNENGDRPASWEDFLKKCSRVIYKPDYVEDLIQRRDYLLACQLIKKKIGPDKFLEMVQEEFQLKGYKPAPIHKHLYNLDCSITISPNFDNIYDDYCRYASGGTFVIKDHTSADIVSYLNKSDVRLLIRNHGSANDPDELIFTAEDYSKARTKYSLFYNVVRSLALTHTFLFIGCGVEDPDLRMLFEDIKFAYGRTPLHYMTTPLGETAPEVLDELGFFMQLRYMKYSPDEGHEELTKSLDELVALVEEKREELANTRGW